MAKRLTHLGNQFNLHASPQRNLRHAERAAGVFAGVAKHLTEQFAAAVGHQLLLGEVGGQVDQAHDFHDAPDLAEVTDGGLQRSHLVDGDGAGCGLAVWFLPSWPTITLPSFFARWPLKKQQLASLHIGQVGGGGRRHFGLCDVQGLEPVVNRMRRSGQADLFESKLM